MLTSRSLIVLIGSAILAPSLTAQSGAEIFDRMRQEYERRMSGVRNYTVVQEVMGMETTTYYEKEIVDGHPVFQLKRTDVGGMSNLEAGDEGNWDKFYVMAAEFGARANYVRRDNVDGAGVHVVEVTDLEELGVNPGSLDDEVAFEAERAMFFVDDSRWVVRRLTFEGTIETDGRSSDATMTIDLTDFREVDGMLHPFVMKMSWEGMGEVTGMNDVDMDELREQLEEMKARMAEMPEAQRAMMERMMKNQMEQLEGMLGEGGDMSIEMRVKELRVNTGG